MSLFGDQHRPLKFFGTAAKGTEPALRDELRELRFRGVRADRGGVHFEGDFAQGVRACFESRIALRVLAPIGEFGAPSEDALYGGIQRLDWSEVLSPEQTFAVSASSKKSRLSHTQYIAQLTKDAIVDQQRRRGERSSVDVKDPDLRISIHLVDDRARVLLDLSGESLHKRSFGRETAEAPIKENLAAALLRYSGWDRQSELFDPMCGAGTILIEAAAWAANLAPGLQRERFGFERWANFDEGARRRTAELRAKLRERVRDKGVLVIGSDESEPVLELARENARKAGVSIQLSHAALKDAKREGPGAIVSNPPYGERLVRSDDLGRELARMVDRHPERSIALILSEEQPFGHTRRNPEMPRQVMNGALECVIRLYAPRQAAQSSGDPSDEPSSTGPAA